MARPLGREGTPSLARFLGMTSNYSTPNGGFISPLTGKDDKPEAAAPVDVGMNNLGTFSKAGKRHSGNPLSKFLRWRPGRRGNGKKESVLEQADLDFMQSRTCHREKIKRKGVYLDQMGLECKKYSGGGSAIHPKVAGVIFGALIIMAGISRCSAKVEKFEDLMRKDTKGSLFAPVQKLHKE